MNKTELIDKLLHLGNTTEMCSSTDRYNAKELAHDLIDEFLESFNYTRCCKSYSEKLVFECKDDWIQHIDNFSDRMECKKCGKRF